MTSKAKVYVITCPHTGIPSAAFSSLAAAKESMRKEFVRWNHASIDSSADWIKQGHMWALRGDGFCYPLCRIYEFDVQEGEEIILNNTAVAIIALVARYKEETIQPLTLTTLRNMLYFLQEYYEHDVGLDFSLCVHGPDDPWITGTLEFLEDKGLVTITKTSQGAICDISLVRKVPTIEGVLIEKAVKSIANWFHYKGSRKITDIQAMLHFIKKHDGLDGEDLIQRVLDIRPSLTEQEVWSAMLGGFIEI